jgi:hypothetical protein
MAPTSLAPALALMYFYISTFRSMCVVPNMALLLLLLLFIIIIVHTFRSSSGRHVPFIDVQCSGTQESIHLFKHPGRRMVAESAPAAVQVLLIYTFTHSNFYPAVSQRSLSTAVSVQYWNNWVFRCCSWAILSSYRQDRNENGMERSLYLSSKRLWSSRRC